MHGCLLALAAHALLRGPEAGPAAAPGPHPARPRAETKHETEHEPVLRLGTWHRSHGAGAPHALLRTGQRKPKLLNAPPSAEPWAEPELELPDPSPAPVPEPEATSEPTSDSEPAGPRLEEPGSNPFSNAVRGVAALALAYLAVHGIADVTVALDILGEDLAAVFEQLKDAVAPSPTLAVLFLALRLQWLSAGSEPPLLVAASNDAAVLAVLLRGVAMVLPHADCIGAKREAILTDLSVLVIFCVTALAVGSTYWPGPAPLPAAAWTAGLAATYVSVSALEHLARRTAANLHVTTVLGLARRVCSLAPMLGVLFLAANMRLESSTSSGTTAWRLSWAMGGCVGALALQALLVLGAPICVRGRLRQGGRPQQQQGLATLAVLAVRSPWEGILVQGIQYLCLATLVFSYTVLLVALVEVPTTPPGLSATVICVLVLSTLFITVYVALALQMQSAPATLLKVREAVEPVPMLAAVCLACRLRALSLRPDLGHGGGPPGWGIDGMYCMASGLALRLTERVIAPKGVVGHVLTGVGLVLVYGGASTVLAAIATMSPANATGEGSFTHSLIHALAHA